MPEERSKRGRRDLEDRLPLIEQAVQSLHRAKPHETVNKPAAVVRAPRDTSAGGTAAEQPAQAKPTTSRLAEIDLARLQKMGLLTPTVTRSRTMEEFRVIKRSILQNAFVPHERGKPAGNLVMVTSSRPGEGKTFTATNLAISIASERDYTVLLIDADFTRPNVLRVLGLEANKGLIDVLEHPSIDLSEVLIRTNIDKLTVLPAGPAPPLSTELLASQRMAAIVEEIARRYSDRIVIFDAPPILSTSEPSALAMHVGQIIFVIEAEKTPRSVVKEALDLVNVGPKIGVVLNRCQPHYGHAQFGSYYKR